MIVIFFILCIFLGIALAPLAVIIVKVRNSKVLKKLKVIRTELRDTKPTIDHARKLRNEVSDLVLTIWKPDVTGEKEAKQLLEDIKELVAEVK